MISSGNTCRDMPTTQTVRQPPSFRRNGNQSPGDDPHALLSGEHPRGHSQGQTAVHRDGHDQDVDDVVAHASPVVDPDEVPEGNGALRLLDKDPGPNLGGLIPLRPLDRPVSKVAPWAQPYLGGSVVKEPDQQEKYGSACYSRKPEYPLHTELVEGRSDEEEQRNRARSLERPHHAHGGSQVSPEPQSDARHRQYGENGRGAAQDHAEEDIELPEIAHDARQHHAGNEQDASKQQESAHPIPVAE